MANNRFSLQFDFNGNIEPIKNSINELRKNLNGINLPDSFATSFTKMFGKLENEVKNFEALTKNGFNNIADVNKAQTAFSRISKMINQITLEVGRVKGIEPERLLPKEIQSRTENLKKKLIEVQKQANKKTGLDEEIKKQNKEIEDQIASLERLKIKREALNKEIKSSSGSIGSQTKKKNAAIANKEGIVAKMTELEGQKGGKTSVQYKELNTELTRLNSTIKNCDSEITRLTSGINKNKIAIASLDGDINNTNNTITNLKTKLTELENTKITPEGLIELRTELAKIKEVDIAQIPVKLNEIEKEINSLEANDLAKLAPTLKQIANATNQVDTAMDGAKIAFQETIDEADKLNESAQQVENLRNQVLQFFTLTNSVHLFKRAINSALNTVKELDATMTEAAVVTEFSISEMWEQLPTYTKQASQLGVAINELYGATTLYYQQGLKTNEAMEIGIETMKMAKIANMEATQATEAMTAALRGFNMELDKTSAVRINDVYSELAAITASDTNQIATAMSKTASIASSANMEFETTAAVLAQIIETTQEAPETAGTALKTIIARFAEVKQLRDQGLNVGTDEEGEEIDVNNIQKALRTVGISMEEFFAGTKGLDEILLELASKWNTLDFETQRYIATTAAGSRQQSRFIAMMSDYERTTQLVTAANNSAGASQKQYEKTLDSLASKLNQLKNAWDSFAMGLSNNEFIKSGVDLLTNLLTTINSLIDGISGGNGLIKSVLSFGAVFGGLKLGKSIISSIGGKNTGEGFFGQLFSKKQIQKDGENLVDNFVNSIDNAARNLWEKNYSRKINFLNVKKDSLNDEQKDHLKSAFGASIAQQLNDDYDFSMQHDLKDDIAQVDEAFESGGPRAAIEQMQKLGYTIDDAIEALKELGPVTQKSTLDFKKLGENAAIAGGALLGISTIMQLLGASDESVQVVQGLGMALMAISTIAPVVQLAIEAVQKGVISSFAAMARAALANPYTYIIIAVTALIGLLAILYNEFKKTTLEYRLEQAKKSAEAAAEAAEEAKNAYDNLLSDTNKYSELENKLSNLTEGTLEWKQALVEANNKALELINTYDKLKEKYTIDSSGAIKFEEGALDSVLEEQLNTVTQANALSLLSQAQVISLEKEQAVQDSRVEYIRQASQIKPRQTAYGAAEDQRLAKEYEEQLSSLNEINIELQNTLEKYNLEIENYYSQAMGILASEEVKEDNNANQLYSVIGKSLNEYFNSEDFNNNLINKSKESLEELKKEYAKIYNMAIEDIPDNIAEDSKLLAQRILQAQTLKNLDLENIIKEINSGVFGDANQIFAAISGDFSNLTIDEIGDIDFNSLVSNESLRELLGYTEEDWKQYLEQYQQIASNYKQQILEGFNFTEDDFNRLNLGQYNIDILEKLQQQYKSFGKEEGEAYIQRFNQLMDDAAATTGVNKQQLEALENAIASTDWSSFNSAFAAMDQMVEIGMDINQAREFWKANTDGANAVVGTLDEALKIFEYFQGKTVSIKEAGEKLKEGTATSEDIKVLQEAGIDLTDKITFTDESFKIAEEYVDQFIKEALFANVENAKNFAEENRINSEDFKNRFAYYDEINQAGSVKDYLSQFTGSERTQQEEKLAAYMAGQGFIESYEDSKYENYDDYVQYALAELQRQYSAYFLQPVLDEEAAWAESQTYIDYETLASEGRDVETLKSILDYQLRSEEAVDEFNNVTEALVEQNTAWKNNTELIKGAVIDANKADKSFKELKEKISEYNDELKIADKENKNFQKAIDAIYPNIKEAFGENVSRDFVVENIDLFTDWANDVEGSTDGIRDKLNQLAIAEAEVRGQGELAREVINALDNTDFSIYGYADFSQLFNSLVAAKGSAEEAASFIEGLGGYEVTWEEVKGPKMAMIGPNGETIILPQYKAVVTNTLDRSGGFTPSSGGGGGSNDLWENPYDELYNIVEKINTELRQRNKIEREYNRILDSRGTTGAQLLKNTQEQLDSLSREKVLQDQLMAGRKRQIEEFESENSNMQKYGKIITDKNGNIRVEINWDLIDSITNTDKGQEIEDYISRLEELRDQVQEVEDSLYDIEDNIKELYEQGKDEYFSLEEAVMSALQETYQERIDDAQRVSDAISESNSELINSIQNSINDTRQARDNQKTEEELSDKQLRLAYLQQDTSGANQLEILQLQKEIEEGQEDYTDTLIDQKISKLQEQNELAAEQRQTQIDIAQAQLDYAIENGKLWPEVEGILESGISKDGTLIKGSELETLLKKNGDVASLSALKQIEWLEEIENQIASGFAWLKQGNSTKGQVATGQLKAGQSITFTNNKGQSITGKVQQDGTVLGNDGKTYTDVYQDYTGQYVSDKAGVTISQGQNNTNKTESNSGRGKIISLPDWLRNSNDIKTLQMGLNDLLKDKKISGFSKLVEDGILGPATKNAIRQLQAKIGTTVDGLWGPNTRSKFKKSGLTAYKTGGLADFTGPAWLDGTKSKPELVLNQEDTQNFLILRDILSSFIKNLRDNTNNSGDNYFEIYINVDEIGSQYDVEKIANDVQDLIRRDAANRNVNVTGIKR